MEAISAIVEEEKMASTINKVIGASTDDDLELFAPVFGKEDVAAAIKNVNITRKNEKIEADRERDELLESGKVIMFKFLLIN